MPPKLPEWSNASGLNWHRLRFHNNYTSCYSSHHPCSFFEGGGWCGVGWGVVLQALGRVCRCYSCRKTHWYNKIKIKSNNIKQNKDRCVCSGEYHTRTVPPEDILSMLLVVYTENIALYMKPFSPFRIFSPRLPFAAKPQFCFKRRT